MKDFKKLIVWEKSHALVIQIYELTSSFPKSEIFGLTNQMRRAIVSVPANIAEGCGRGSDADMARFFQISLGSISEVEYYVILSKDLNFLSPAQYEIMIKNTIEVKKMLCSLIKTIRSV